MHLAAGADANAKDEGEWAPLHGASGSGHREIVELLLANGAKVNVPALSGKTALDYASRAGHKETANLLRQHGGKTRADLKAEGK
jgi:ankyrin repeat protein